VTGLALPDPGGPNPPAGRERPAGCERPAGS